MFERDDYLMRTRIWKLTALVVALLLALTGCSLIEVDQEMDYAEAVATVNGVTITKGEVKDTYEYYQNYYAYMNYYYTGNSDISSQLEDIKDNVLEAFIRSELVKEKAAELGLDTLSDDDKASIEAQAAQELEDALNEEIEEGHIDTEGLTEEEIHAAALAHLEEEGVTLDSLIESDTTSFIADRVRENVIADIAVEDSEIQEAFDKEVADDESSFTNSTYLYELYRSNGTTIYWNPEGYRTVKHILLQMSDDQKSELTALEDELTSVQDMIDALENPEENSEEASEEATEEAEPALSLDELNARKAEIEKSIEDKKAEIIASFSETTDEIYQKLEDGASFDDLMAEYGEDPGMKSEPAMTEGYYVAETSTIWESVFTETAMSLEKIGDVSEPVLGSNGVHIIYYNADVTPGAIDIATVRDDLAATLLTDKQDEAYDAAYQSWRDTAKVQKYPGRMNY